MKSSVFPFALNVDQKSLTTKKLEEEKGSAPLSVRKDTTSRIRQEKTRVAFVYGAARLISPMHPKNTLDSAPSHVLRNIDMQNDDYKVRVHHYLVSRTYLETMVKNGELSTEDFNEINAELLAKYNLSERSIFNA